MLAEGDFELRRSDLCEADMVALLTYHVRDMVQVSPPGTSFALDLDALRAPGVSVWGLWIAERLAGCGAIVQHDADMAELKSMRTHPDVLRQGVARRILEHLISEARQAGLSELKLETGTAPVFDAAVALYRRYGFTACGPFADYTGTVHNQYMQLAL